MSDLKQQILSMIESANKIALVTHHGPDIDAYSSVTSLYEYFTKKYPSKNIEMIIEDRKPTNILLKSNTDIERINWIEDLSTIIPNYDLVVFIDSAVVQQFTHTPEKVDLSTFKSICIDHHGYDPEPFTLAAQGRNFQSCTAYIWDLLIKDELELLSNKLAKKLATGILGDTNFFRFTMNYQKATVGALYEIMSYSDIDLRPLADEITTLTKDEYEAYDLFVDNMTFMELPNVPKLMFTYLTQEQVVKYSDKPELMKVLTEYITHNIIRYVEGYYWGFIIKPRGNGDFDISFRSHPGSVNVRELASKYFNGGGHITAAGGSIKLETDDVQVAIKEIFERIKNAEIKLLLEKEGT